MLRRLASASAAPQHSVCGQLKHNGGPTLGRSLRFNFVAVELSLNFDGSAPC